MRLLLLLVWCHSDWRGKQMGENSFDKRRSGLLWDIAICGIYVNRVWDHMELDPIQIFLVSIPTDPKLDLKYQWFQNLFTLFLWVLLVIGCPLPSLPLDNLGSYIFALLTCKLQVRCPSSNCLNGNTHYHPDLQETWILHVSTAVTCKLQIWWITL